jgi:hypothetical protein
VESAMASIAVMAVFFMYPPKFDSKDLIGLFWHVLVTEVETFDQTKNHQGVEFVAHPKGRIPPCI